jgi:hypothetical protein
MSNSSGAKCSRKGILWAYTWAVIFALVTTQGCLATEPNEAQAIEFSWINCDAAATSYFTVTIPSSGDARYVGGARAKIVGAQALKLDQAQAVQLIRAGKGVARKAEREKSFDGEGKTSARSPYCLHVKIPATGTESDVRLSDSRAKHFNKIADDALHFKQLVCPGRLGLLSGDYACDPPLIRYTFGREPPCNGTQWLLIYPSGDVLHSISLDEKQDRFFKMQPAEAIDLARMAVHFEVLGNETETEHGAIPRLVRGTKAEQADFVRQLERLTATPWEVLGQTPSPCSAEYLNYVPYQGVLVYEERLQGLSINQTR